MASFLPEPPKDWSPATPSGNEAIFFRYLDEFEAKDEQKKKRPKRILMSPDDIEMQGEENKKVDSPSSKASRELFPPSTIAIEHINEEKQKTGQIAAMCTANQRDEHGRIHNTHRAYHPKLQEFKLFCRTFYNQDEALTYQITKAKVETYLTYSFYREVKPRGRRKGAASGAKLDYLKANEIIKAFQSAKVRQTKYNDCDCVWLLLSILMF